MKKVPQRGERRAARAVIRLIRSRSGRLGLGGGARGGAGWGGGEVVGAG